MLHGSCSCRWWRAGLSPQVPVHTSPGSVGVSLPCSTQKPGVAQVAYPNSEQLPPQASVHHASRKGKAVAGENQLGVLSEHVVYKLLG